MPYSLLSDTELWNLFLKGDKKALAYIYKKAIPVTACLRYKTL